MISDRRSGISRSQSEAVGVLLLTAVIVVLVTVVGAFSLTQFVSTGEAQPLLEIDGNATTQYVTVEHAGGETLRTSDLAVVVSGDSQKRYSLSSFTQRVGDDVNRFEPGDAWRGPTEVDGTKLDVLLIHDPSNAVVARADIGVRVTIAARFSISPDSPTQGEQITFDAAASEVKGGTLASYAWDVDDDGSTDYTGQTATQTFTDDGTYPVTLTVTADDGRTASTTTNVDVGNVRPTASFTISTSPAGPGETVTFDASGSSDPDGSISSYSWTFGDGTTATDATPTHTYSSVGSYTVDLAVTDTDGGTDTARQTLAVSRTYFDVSIDSTTSPVTEGQTLSVDATVNNTGVQTGTQTIELSVGGTVEDTQSVTLAPSDAPQTVTMTWQTAAGDSNGSPYTATVASDNTSESASVSVLQQEAVLSVGDVRGLTDQAATHDYQPEIDVEETNNVETHDLAVQLVIEDGAGTEVFNVTNSGLAEIQSATRTAAFSVGQLPPGSYSYTVTATATNADAVTSTGSFVVSGAFDAATVSDLDGNTNGQTQTASSTLSGALAEGETVTVDLSNAGTDRVDYSGASVSTTAGSGTSSITADGVVTYTAGAGGDGDGSTIEVELMGVDTKSTQGGDLTYTVSFDRSDGTATSTDFTVVRRTGGGNN